MKQQSPSVSDDDVGLADLFNNKRPRLGLAEVALKRMREVCGSEPPDRMTKTARHDPVADKWDRASARPDDESDHIDVSLAQPSCLDVLDAVGAAGGWDAQVFIDVAAYS